MVRNTPLPVRWTLLKSGCDGPAISTLYSLLPESREAGSECMWLVTQPCVHCRNSEEQARSLAARDGTIWKGAVQYWLGLCQLLCQESLEDYLQSVSF